MVQEFCLEEEEFVPKKLVMAYFNGHYMELPSKELKPKALSSASITG